MPQKADYCKTFKSSCMIYFKTLLHQNFATGKENFYKYLCNKSSCKNNFVHTFPLLLFHCGFLVNPDSRFCTPEVGLCWCKLSYAEVGKKKTKHKLIFRNMAEFEHNSYNVICLGSTDLYHYIFIRVVHPNTKPYRVIPYVTQCLVIHSTVA